MEKLWNKKWFPYLALAVWTFIALAICSCNSFLFRMNEWSDVDCYLSVAKMMKSGSVLYRDVFEQKGPYLYFFHVAAIWITEKSYMGVFCMELVFDLATAFFAYKTIGLFVSDKKHQLLWSLLFVSGYLMCFAFAQGDSAEEMVIPYMCAALYFMLKSIVKGKHMPWYEMILLGFFTGMAILIKFTLIGLFGIIALYVFVLDIKDKKVGTAFLQIPLFLVGLVISFIPAVLYFHANDAMSDFIKVYFYDNIFLYSKTSNTSPSRQNGFFARIGCMFLGYLISTVMTYPATISMVFAVIYAYKKKLLKTRLFIFSAIAYLGTAASIYVTGKIFVYYGLPLMLFMLPAINYLEPYVAESEKIQAKIKKLGKKLVPTYLAVLFLGMLIINEDTYHMFQPKKAYYQYNMKEIIDDYRETHDDDPTLLNYGYLDGGLYFICDITPTCKYFHTLNMDYEEMFTMQDDFIKNGKITFIVTRSELKPEYDKYTLVYHKKSYYEFRPYDYYLYELTDAM